MKPFLIALVYLFINIKTNAQHKNEVLGKINMQKKDNFITLRAQVENESILFKDELNYTFIVLKKGQSGNYSNNKDSGEFSLKPQEENKELALVRVNLEEKEELRAYLFIRKKDKLISKDSIWLGVKKQNKKVQTNTEKDFFIKGIVIDEAITKIGKDFHDFFYQEYLLSGKKYPFIIKIKEKPGLARSSIIYVEAEDIKIYEFFAKPEEEYLKNNVKTVLNRTNIYAKRRKALRKASKI